MKFGQLVSSYLGIGAGFFGGIGAGMALGMVPHRVGSRMLARLTTWGLPAYGVWVSPALAPLLGLAAFALAGSLSERLTIGQVLDTEPQIAASIGVAAVVALALSIIGHVQLSKPPAADIEPVSDSEVSADQAGRTAGE